MMFASLYGHTDIVRLLIPFEAKTSNADQKTALMSAAGKGHTKIVELLVPHEAKAQDHKGFTALMNAAQGGHFEAACILAPLEATMTRPNGQTAMMSAAIHNHATIVQLLVPQEACKRTNQGQTALMLAAMEGHADVVSVLVEHEAKMKNEGDFTALMNAAREGHIECVRILIPFEAGITTSNGWTALMSAAANGYIDAVQLILPHEAGCRTEEGLTATTLAALGYQPECFEELMWNDAEWKKSQIPEVMVSAYAGDIRDLLARRCEWQTKDVDLTALDFALLGNQGRAVRLLASSVPLREFFGRESIPNFIKDRSNATRFLSSRERFIHNITPAISATTPKCRSELLVKALVEQHHNTTRVLRTICTPDAGSTFERLGECGDENQIVGALKGLKHVGFSSGGKTVLDLGKEQDGPVQTYIEANPLRRKQVEFARREAEKSVPDIKQAASRETEAEAAFNGALV